MTEKKILFIDLMYSKNGSFDDDFFAISQALFDIDFDYLKLDVNKSIKAVMQTFLVVLSFKYRKVVLLSSRVSQLLLLLPLRLVCQVYVIYHFMPNSRIKFHSYTLPLLSKVFIFATYCSKVSDVFFQITGKLPLTLPSRIVNSFESEQRLRNKFFDGNLLNVFIPGVRPGVRKFIDPLKLINKLQHVIKFGEIHLFIQDNPSNKYINHPEIEFVPIGMPKDKYDAMYQTCHVIAVEFEDAYEVRASGVILDAAAFGCIVLTDDHPINQEYGFPNTILCNLDNISTLVNKICSKDSIQHLFPGKKIDDFRLSWRTFLNLNTN